MNKAPLSIVKESYTMDDGTVVRGIRVCLAPTLSKFISIEVSNKMSEKLKLLEACNPEFAHLYTNIPEGSEVIFTEDRENIEVKRK